MAMNIPSLTQLIPVLQLSISPVILISGVGLLLLTLTNRFGRMIDRARVLHQEMARQPSGAENLRAQIEILHRRAVILRLSIVLGVTTVLMAAVLILVLFLTALFKLEAGLLIVGIFCVGQVSLIGSMAAFIRDTNLSMVAIKMELGGR
jgi:hypothetical protein